MTVGSFGWLKRGDPRNMNFLMREVESDTTKLKPKVWKAGPATDQGDTPHCVGFSGENWQLASPTMDPIGSVIEGHSLYALCKQIDGDNQDGSTTNSLLKALRARGMIHSWHWAENVQAAKLWLERRGTLFLGSYWYEGMMKPDVNGIVTVSGAAVGGHETLVLGWTIMPGHDDMFLIRNSWGESWGIKGMCWISETDLAFLLAHDGEAAGAVETDWRKHQS